MSDTKHCSRCDMTKSISEFGNNKTRYDGHSVYCLECSRSINKKYQKSNSGSDAHKNWYRQNRYGVDNDWYNKQFELQHGCCAICGRHQSELDKGLDIDHCHRTGIVRKLLCAQCNSRNGMFNDDPELLERAAAYLREFM